MVTDASSPVEASDAGALDGGEPSFDGGDGDDDAGVSPDGGALDGGTPVDAGGEVDGAVPDASIDSSVPELDGAVMGDAGDEPDAAPPAPRCGDGNLDELEQCDDANTESWDGCSSDCRDENVAWIARVNSAGADGDVVLSPAADDGVIVSVNTTLDGAEAIAGRAPYIVALDAQGAEAFRIGFSMSGSSYFHFDAYPIAADGSLRVVAQFDGAVTLPDSPLLTAPSGRRAAFIASYDSRGDLEWALPLRHASTLDAPALAHVRVLPDGQLVAAGQFARAEPIAVGDAGWLLVPVARGAGSPRSLFTLRIDRRGRLVGSAGFVVSTPAANGAFDLADVVALDADQILVMSGAANTRYTFAGGTSEERVVTAASLAVGFDGDGTLRWSLPYARTFLRGGSRALSSGLLALLGRNGGANETLFVTTDGALRMQKRGAVIGEGTDEVIRLGSGYSGGTFTTDGHMLSSPLAGITRYAIAYTPEGEYVWAHNLVSSSATTIAIQPPTTFGDGSFVGAGECPELVGEGTSAQMPTADLCIARFDADGVLDWNRELSGSFALAAQVPPYKPSVAVTASNDTWLLLESTASWSFAPAEPGAELESGSYLVQLAADGSLTRAVRAGASGLSIAAPLLSADDAVIAAIQHEPAARLFAGDPADTVLSLDAGDANGLVVVKMRQ
jgi:cysteine-rich repeat protein